MITNSGALILPSSSPATNSAANLDIRGLKAPIAIPVIWVWMAWITGLIIASLVGYYLWKRWQAKKNAPKPAIVVPPHRRARERLLRALNLLNQPVPFCVLVSDTIRQYLEERFELHAPERTTEEFLTELQSSPVLSQEQKDSLANFLTQCDLVKFARHEPSQPDLQRLYDSALTLIEQTEYVAPVAPDAVTK